VVLLAGALYLVIGRAFPAPIVHVRAWRFAAWLVSGIVFAAHIWYEHVRLRHAPAITARHAATGVAIGAFALAAAGMVRTLAVESAIRPRWFLALVAWPLVTALPAFLVAIVTATVLRRLRPSPP